MFLLAFLLCPALLFARPARAAGEEEGVTMVSGAVAVRFPSGQAGAAREAAATANYALGRILKQLGIVMQGQVRVTLVLTREQFNRACGREMPDWALAAALPPGEIVADASRSTPATANDIHVSMIHEMVHLALGQAEGPRPDRLPLWFHEGAATWLSGRQLLMLNRGLFHTAAEHGNLIPLADLAREFPEEAARADLAYLESEDFIGWLAEQSPEGLHGILDRYKGGRTFDEAFAEAVGMSVLQAERRWAGPLRRPLPWLRTLLRSLTFWGAMSVATVLVFLIVRRRAKLQHKVWEEEERVFTVLDLDEPPGQEPDEEEDSDEHWDPGEPIHG
jgi:hypothetical protein